MRFTGRDAGNPGDTGGFVESLAAFPPDFSFARWRLDVRVHTCPEFSHNILDAYLSKCRVSGILDICEHFSG